MINSYIDGNLIEFYKQNRYWGIAHGCNCFCTMGSGIAKTIRNEFPKAFIVDTNTKKGDRFKLGTFSSISLKHGIIYNLYTQYTYWDPNDLLDYSAVGRCFSLLDQIYLDLLKENLIKKESVFGIPKIGAGLARGDWDTIEKIINENTPNINIECVVFK
jgi:O-acetyl-ADP-ribose deacetylase (regulator of RNase III)